jgi:hypothetical protein
MPKRKVTLKQRELKDKTPVSEVSKGTKRQSPGDHEADRKQQAKTIRRKSVLTGYRTKVEVKDAGIRK